jgi:hypothetical protein
MKWHALLRTAAGFALVMILCLGARFPAHAGAATPETDSRSLPRFTEEREAAALCFVKKHLPELAPLLEQLKKNNNGQYQHEIREIFQATEWLADLQDDTKRYDLELKIWKTENKAHMLAARLTTAADDEKKKLEIELQALAKDLVELDVAILEVKAEQLDKELGEIKDELAKAKENTDRQIKDRYEQLLEKAKKKRK